MQKVWSSNAFATKFLISLHIQSIYSFIVEYDRIIEILYLGLQILYVYENAQKMSQCIYEHSSMHTYIEDYSMTV